MSNIGDLQKRLGQRLQSAKKKAKELEKESFDNFKEQLTEITQTALKTTQKDINSHLEEVREELKEMHSEISSQTLIARAIMGRFWRTQIALTSGIILTIFGGSWGWMQYVSAQTRSHWEEQEKALRNTVSLRQDSWGVTLIQTDNGRFVVLPPNHPQKTNWTCLGRPCIKLGNTTRLLKD